MVTSRKGCPCTSDRGAQLAIRGIDHVDLAVSDVDRSLAFYLGMLGPLGLAVEGRFRTYRGTEDVVYLAPIPAPLNAARPQPAPFAARPNEPSGKAAPAATDVPKVVHG